MRRLGKTSTWGVPSRSITASSRSRSNGAVDIFCKSIEQKLQQTGGSAIDPDHVYQGRVTRDPTDRCAGRLSHTFEDRFPNTVCQALVVADPFAAPLMLVGCRKFLHDDTILGVDVDARRISMAMTGRRREGCMIFDPVRAARADWSQVLNMVLHDWNTLSVRQRCPR